MGYHVMLSHRLMQYPNIKKDIKLVKVVDFTKEAKIVQGTVYSAVQKSFIKVVNKQHGMQTIKVVPHNKLKKFNEVMKK